MTINKALAAVLCIGCASSGSASPAKPDPGRFHERHDSVDAEKLGTDSKVPRRWVEVHVGSQKFLIAKIADASHFPEPDEKLKPFFKKSDGPKSLFYLYIPNSYRGSNVELHDPMGKTQRLSSPQLVFRMPGSGLYTPFLWNPSRAGFLLVTCKGTPSKVDLGEIAENLGELPFFWNGKPPRIAVMDLPPWMMRSMP